ncbi:formimidoylglutamase [Nemorincola caseinilytica]|uniref:Formimidoylglutamase n=1 Tax=Nemorincola caseinilytica TaxID=2054315 RepID=A0ABP8N707_9BACT
MNDIHIFLEEEHFIDSRLEGVYEPSQVGGSILHPGMPDFDVTTADVVLIGCADWTGADKKRGYGNGPDTIREHFYKMYHWHDNVRIADLGNIRRGATSADTRSALVTVLQELHSVGKTALVLGGAHDLMLQQYEVFRRAEQTAVATVVDMLIDLDETEGLSDKGFLMEMLTETPNFISHYDHLGFQIYYSHPQMVDTLNKLSFDLYRLAKLREDWEEIEPVVRRSNLMSFDMTAVRYSDAPANRNGSPNGLNGEEACMFAQFAGMCDKLSSFGIYGYDEANDVNDMTARLISQMIWYYADGCQVRKKGITADNTEDVYMEFNLSLDEVETVFLKNKYNGRWSVRLPQGTILPCSYRDYQVASTGELPERLLRELERLA